MIPDEPVRGRTPPPWIGALAGIERCRAYSQGFLPCPPIGRLFGLRTNHVAAGVVTMTMPATDASIAGNGVIEVSPVMVGALEGASHTALAAGFDIYPLRLDYVPFRPAWPGRGNLVARARVVNNSNLFVYSEVQVEDSEGRHIAQGSLESAVFRIDPPPPAPPARMELIQEPVYDTADPYLRKYALSLVGELMQQADGPTLIAKFQAGEIDIPVLTVYGLRLEIVGDGRIELSMPASEWFCSYGPYVSCQAMSGLAQMSLYSGVFSLHDPGSSLAMLGSTTAFMRRAKADGRPIRAAAVVSNPAPRLYSVHVDIHDADGQLLAQSWASAGRFDDSRRQRRKPKAARRILATLLFLDIVDSSGHATRLGDAAWRALLEDYRLKVRREISRFSGTEVDTAGDGFFVRFESPAYAIDAARAAIAAAGRLGLVLRAGIHAGECELEGNRLAGMAVHVAARIMAEAGPGEIVVSSTVKELTGGAGFHFEDRGERVLKGVPEPWRVLAVAD